MKLLSGLKTSLTIATLVAFLTGCAATEVALTKKDLDVQTKTSTAIFVDPVSPEKRTVYVDVKSGVQEFDRAVFKRLLLESFANNSNNYRIVDDPEKAQYTLSAFVLNLEKASPSASQLALSKGYQGTGVLAGAALGAQTNNGYKGALAGAVVGGATDLISGALVKDVTYMLVCDIQIKERAKNGVVVTRDTSINTKVSDNGGVHQSSTEQSNQKEYATRIVTTANKANLKLEEAQDPIYKKTAAAIAGFF